MPYSRLCPLVHRTYYPQLSWFGMPLIYVKINLQKSAKQSDLHESVDRLHSARSRGFQWATSACCCDLYQIQGEGLSQKIVDKTHELIVHPAELHETVQVPLPRLGTIPHAICFEELLSSPSWQPRLQRPCSTQDNLHSPSIENKACKLFGKSGLIVPSAL